MHSRRNISWLRNDRKWLRREHKNKNSDYKDVQKGKLAVKRIKSKLLPAIVDAINKPFQSLSDSEEIFQAMLIADHSAWDFDDNIFGIDKIKELDSYFETP